jgi:hypothetical protein
LHKNLRQYNPTKPVVIPAIAAKNGGPELSQAATSAKVMIISFGCILEIYLESRRGLEYTPSPWECWIEHNKHAHILEFCSRGDELLQQEQDRQYGVTVEQSIKTQWQKLLIGLA